MRLSAKVIKNYANINNFDYGNEWRVRQGDANSLYFQLVDLDLDGNRYLAGIGGGNQPFSIQVTFPSVDDAKVIQLAATQADANDSSIWKVDLTSLQQPFSGNVQFQVTEGSTIRKFNVSNMIVVELLNSGGC